jgi:glycosyltransferase involved in cell wall biosynthesis
MKLAVVSSEPVPRTYGGMDRLLEGLTAALRRQHPTDLVTVPVDERTSEGVLKGYYDFYQLDLSAYDAVISYKGPAYMVRHPAHVLYLSHRLRVFYDLYEPRDAQHARMRRLIQWMDNWAMAPERIARVFCVGQTVSRRLLKWGGIASTPLHHPTTFEAAAPRAGEHFFAPGRLHAWKRFDLIIRAMKASRAEVPLVIVGKGPDEAALRELAGGDRRFRFLGHVDEPTLRRLYARAIATIFPPINEDLGLVTFESFLSAKPVLTTADAGEPALIVRDGVSGFVTAPTPQALAERLEWMGTHRDACEAMGRAGLEQMREVTWERLTDALLRAVEKGQRTKGKGQESCSSVGPSSFVLRPSPGAELIRLLVTDNQMIDPPVGGGRVRIWELYRHLPEDFTTTYLGTHDHPGPQFRDQWMAPNFREIVMPLTAIHFRRHEFWRRLTRGAGTIDVTMPLLLGRSSPRYSRLLAGLLPTADLLICSHPWMFPWLPPNGGPPLVYDSHNCEAAVKAALLSRTMAGRYLARRVERTERLAVTRSALVLACSPEDARQYVERYEAPRERLVDVPNGVDCERLRPADAARRAGARRDLGLGDGPLAIFVGSNYPPNVEAVDSLARDVATPLPELTILVAGGAGPAWLQTQSGAEPPSNVRVLGIVDGEALAGAYAAADFGLNPMRLGSGTNIKMLDYMAAGLAIVTSDVGARGLAGEAGRHWRLADRGESARELRELIEHPETARGLAAEARALAERTYDWRAIAARLAEALRELVDKERRAK